MTLQVTFQKILKMILFEFKNCICFMVAFKNDYVERYE